MINTQKLDNRIASLEQELAGLRRQKLESLQAIVAKLQADISGTTAASYFSAPTSAEPARRGPKPKDKIGGSEAKHSRRGPRGKRLTSDEVMLRLTEAVRTAGAEGISARQAAAESGVFYLRALKVMEKGFRKTGKGKWTRFTLK